MNHFAAMLSPKASKAYVAAVIAGLSSAVIASPEGFTLTEILVLVLAVALSFQATYWTTNEPTYDGDIVVEQTEDKKLYSLNLNEDLDSLDNKSQLVFKIKK